MNTIRGGVAGSARVFLAGLLTLLWVGAAGAQQPQPQRPSAGAAVLRIRKMPRLGRGALQRTPQYQHNVDRALGGPSRKREWAVLDVIYETAPEWVDELDFAFHVMSEGRSPEGRQEFSLFQATVAYADVARGEHVATVVLPPAAVERFGNVVACGVEVSVAGQKLAQDNVTAIKLPDAWWSDPRVIDNPAIRVVKRSGYLADRSKTPFALANIDDYEAVK
jgi:hypothetical protein